MTPNFLCQDELGSSNHSPLNDENLTEQLVNLDDRGKTLRASQAPLLATLTSANEKILEK